MQSAPYIPTDLLTDRLHLRMPEMSDAPALQAIAGDPRVSATTASIPYPYPDGGAEAFIADIRREQRCNLAITLREGGAMIGMVGYKFEGELPELAYMIGHDHWGRGYASEAARALTDHVFAATDHNCLMARAMVTNPASEAVLRRLGFVFQKHADVDVPLRGGGFASSFWLLNRPEGIQNR